VRTVRFIGAGGWTHHLPVLADGRVLVPRELLEREEALLFACEHEETGAIRGEPARAIAALLIDASGGPRPVDPARGGFLVPLPEWHRRVRVPAPSFVRLAGEAESPVWLAKPAAVPWPAPVAGPERPPTRRLGAPAPAGRSTPSLSGGIAWALTLACLAGFVGTIQWAIESRGALGLGQVANGLLLAGALAFLARLARAAAGEARPALLAGRLALAGGLVVAGALAVSLLL
jgi:hypothetical protein